MNMNSRYLNEAKELEKRWAKTGLLKGLSKKYLRSSTAVLLESQRLMNEQSVKELPPCTSIFCPRCGAILKECAASEFYKDDPKRFKCEVCHGYFRGEFPN